MWWTSFKYLLLGVAIWTVALLFLGGSDRFTARSEPAQLIVLRIDRQKDDHPTRTALGSTWRYTYRPVFALDTKARPRPDYAGNVWSTTAPHQVGEVVPGRYDRVSGEMQSDKMLSHTVWLARIAQAVSLLSLLQAVLALFGVPEVLMPLRVRLGSQS